MTMRVYSETHKFHKIYWHIMRKKLLDTLGKLCVIRAKERLGPNEYASDDAYYTVQDAVPRGILVSMHVNIYKCYEEELKINE